MSSAPISSLLVLAALFCAGAAGFNFWVAFAPNAAMPAVNFAFGCVAAVCIVVNIMNAMR